MVIVNTCSVTAEADRAARAFIRRTHRQNPAAKIVVTGCYAQRAPEELAAMAGVAAVVGNSHKALAPEIILGPGEAAAQHAPIARADCPVAIAAPAAALLTPVESRRADLGRRSLRAFVPGRDAACARRADPAQPEDSGGMRQPLHLLRDSPDARLLQKSARAQRCCRQVEGFVAAGGNELVLSGINLGRWGRDLAGTAVALRVWSARFSSTPRLPRLRLSSIEPMDWDDELIGLMAEFGGTRGCAAPRASAPAIRLRRRAAPHAPPLPALALRGEGCRPAARRRPRAHPGRRRHGWLSRRNRRRIRRDAGLGPRAALRLSAPVSRFRRGPARAAGHCMQQTLSPRRS